MEIYFIIRVANFSRSTQKLNLVHFSANTRVSVGERGVIKTVVYFAENFPDTQPLHFVSEVAFLRNKQPTFFMPSPHHV